MKRKSTSVCITPVSEASFSRAGPNSSTKESPMIHSFIGSAAVRLPTMAGGGGGAGVSAPRAGRAGGLALGRAQQRGGVQEGGQAQADQAGDQHVARRPGPAALDDSVLAGLAHQNWK